MESKLTKEELQDQLYSIKEKEKELTDELLCQNYLNLSYFEIWKKCNNWKKMIYWSIIYDVLIFLLNDNNKIQSLWLMLILPFLFFIASLSNALEIKNSIIYIKKKKQIN